MQDKNTGDHDMIDVTVTFAATPGAEFVVPMGMETPHCTPLSFAAEGATLRVVGAPGLDQRVALGRAEEPLVTLRYSYAATGTAYPEALFRDRDSRFTRSAAALATEAQGIAEAAGGGRDGMLALVHHVTRLFDYGHVEERFYDGTDEMPQLCGLTKGSCVDINAYLIAALRAAGYEAGYMTGYFIPEEKRDRCNDMHCWVVTRCDGQVEEWDIAHHLKMGRSEVVPGLNPKPGVRVPLAHSMGWTLPAVGVVDHKLMSQPQWLRPDGVLEWEAEVEIRLAGYEVLAGAA